MSPKRYAKLCGIYMTRYQGLKPEDGPKQAYDANRVYKAQADGYGGADVKSQMKINRTKKRPK